MHLTDDERTTFSHFRNVSDLRVQFLCEFRFYLQEKHGQQDTDASIEGSRLHDSLAASEDSIRERQQMIPILIIIAAIVIGYLWIFG
ncbi:hypothetical protein EU528_14280 [Candidatus Thorarchaeota archaeon]|nr:MAG: hypothetical protein EU528_14280 [Candidatus Thorarchaeota archaeon]